MDLRQYIATALRWWWLMILGAVIAAAISYWVSQKLPRVYSATTTLIVGQSIQATRPTDADIVTSQQLAQTYAYLAKRQPVLQGVIDTLSLDETWQDLEKQISVNPVINTQLLQITVEAGSPEEAKMTADEIARQLILLSPTALEEQKNSENQQLIRQQLENLQNKITTGRDRTKELEAAMNASLSAQQVQELQTEINTLEQLITNWENNYTQLLIFAESKASPNYLVVVEPAQVDPKPVRPRLLFNTFIAGVAGLFLSLAAVFLLEYMDDTLKSVDELGQSSELMILGAIGRIRGMRYPRKLIAARDPFSPITEAYRMIRSNIQFVSGDGLTKSIIVTSPTPAEGKSVTVANLGVIMAQAGLRTIIVDADLRQPVLHQIFELANEGGLIDLLRSPELEINECLKDTKIEHLQLLTSGGRPPNPAELLGSERMGRLLTQLNDLADVVIYDSPPVLAVTDATVLANRVDGVILVIELGRTRFDAASQAILNLQQAKAHLLGSILNRVPTKKGRYYYYHSYPSNGRRPTVQPAPVKQ